MAKTKKQLATEKITKLTTKNLRYKVLKQKKNVVIAMQYFRAPINPQEISEKQSQKLVRNAHKNIAHALGENFLNDSPLKDKKFRARASKDWGFETKGNKIIVMALARGGFVGAKAFGEHIGSYLGYVVTEKTQGRNVKVTEYNTCDINRSEITDVIYYDPSIYSANSLFEAIKAGYQEQGFNQPQIHVVINLSYCDSLQWLDDKLEEFNRETKNTMPPINVIIAQLDILSNNNLPQLGINDTGDRLFGEQNRGEKAKIIEKYQQKYQNHNQLINVNFIQYLSDSDESIEDIADQKPILREKRIKNNSDSHDLLKAEPSNSQSLETDDEINHLGFN